MKLKKFIPVASIVAGATPVMAQSTIYICQSCAAGTYSDGTLTSCKNCSAGTYSTGSASSCTACPVGTYSGSGASSCSPCSGATYGSWGASCGDSSRTKTTYCSKTGSTSEKANPETTTDTGNAGTCGAGQTCSSGSCTNCTTGYYKSSSGNGACTACTNKPANNSTYTYSSGLTSNSCPWKCDSGYSDVNGVCKPDCPYIIYTHTVESGSEKPKKAGIVQTLAYGSSIAVPASHMVSPGSCQGATGPCGASGVYYSIEMTMSNGTTKTVKSGSLKCQ